jgi:hypothetical protein
LRTVDPAVISLIERDATLYREGNVSAWKVNILDDAAYIGSDGAVDTRESLGARIRPATRPADRISEETFRTYGNTVIRTFRRESQRSDGKFRADRMTVIYVKLNGEWKIAHLQTTVIQKREKLTSLIFET